MSHCRTCRKELVGKIIPGFMNITDLFGEGEGILDTCFCDSPECLDQKENLCEEELSCGHFCIGHKAHNLCPKICTEPGCSRCTGPQTTTEDCVYCTSPLSSEPCAHLKCGHVFHYNCLNARIQSKWDPTGPINLSFAACPFCKQQIQYEGKEGEWNSDCALTQATKRIKNMGSHIGELIKQVQDDDKMGLEEGMRAFNFFECHKCKSIYCGGKRECAALVDVSMDPKEMICAGCRSCKTHGTDMMTFKCRFCCSPSKWFCFGTTHFCEPCHSRANVFWNGHASTSIPKCKGKCECPLGMDHPPNGEEFAFCIACQQQHEYEEKRDEENPFADFKLNIFIDEEVVINNADNRPDEWLAAMELDIFVDIKEERVINNDDDDDGADAFLGLFGDDDIPAPAVVAVAANEDFNLLRLFGEEEGDQQQQDDIDPLRDLQADLFFDVHDNASSSTTTTTTTTTTTNGSALSKHFSNILYSYGSSVFVVGLAIMLNNICSIVV